MFGVALLCLGLLNGAPKAPTRRDTLAFVGRATSGLAALALSTDVARAAPPIAVIEEQLGYLPVIDGAGRKVFAPARIFEPSTPQALALAKHLKRVGATFYGAYWCPHCKNQRRMFGKEGLKMVNYVECDPRGLGHKSGVCERAAVDGYPMWVIGKQRISGERPLSDLAKFSEFPGTFDQALEPSPATMGGVPCPTR
jgi:hypothetical protein